MPIVRASLNAYEAGEEYLANLAKESDVNFRILLALLSSYWQSGIDGPNYARELKAVALELSRVRLLLEEVRQDADFSTTRTEFLYQVVTSVLFPQGRVPDLGKTDVDFQAFLAEIVKIYFAGSVPESIKKAVDLVIGAKSVVRENFEEARRPGSGFDISDQFGFTVDVALDSPGQVDLFLADRNVRILLSIIRPSHTLYRLKYILNDLWLGPGPSPADPPSDVQTHKAVDKAIGSISNYGYEDFRRFVEGVKGVDVLGGKAPIEVVDEDHSHEF